MRSERKAVVLTALQVEYQAARAHLADLEEVVHKGTIYERGRFKGAEEWDVLLCEAGAGNVTSGIECERAVSLFVPELVVMIGVAGGLKDVYLGDVVAATKVYYIENGKVVADKLLARPHAGNSSYALEQRAKAESRKPDWLARRRYLSPSRIGDNNAPRVFVAPIAAGEKVIAATEGPSYESLKSSFSDALAVEMEAFGIIKAAHLNHNLDTIIVRGISDRLDKKEASDGQGWQEIASVHAAAFAFEVLSKHSPMEQDEQAHARINLARESPARSPSRQSSSGKSGAGNVLGNVRAEADLLMLEKAFVETSDYKALTTTEDFHVVVGRRGTGKSALHRKTLEYFSRRSDLITVGESHQEHQVARLYEVLKTIAPDYRGARMIMRLCWKLSVSIGVLGPLLKNYRSSNVNQHPFLADYFLKHRSLAGLSAAERCHAILKSAASVPYRAIPAGLSEAYDFNQLTNTLL